MVIQVLQLGAQLTLGKEVVPSCWTMLNVLGQSQGSLTVLTIQSDLMIAAIQKMLE